MYLTQLSLTNFRNFARLDINVPAGPVLLVGENAQGKTSLLEAIYYLATFVSFHASNERQLINLTAVHDPVVVARIIARFKRFDGPLNSPELKNHSLEVRLIIEDPASNGANRLRKEILLDGAKQKMSDVMGVFNAVLFLPQMLRIIDGSPEDRRRYLNLAMGQVLPNFGGRLTDYAQVLTQRNALLKQLIERSADINGASYQLAYWDEQIARMGAEIMQARIQALGELEQLASRFHHDLTHGQEVLRIIYQPSFEPLRTTPGQFTMKLETAVDRSGLSQEAIYRVFLEQLTRLRAEELARGVTTIGPHRDEIRFLANQLDLGTYGSRGQARTAVLALKLAEVAWMKKRGGNWPVLLLDEVLAELDSTRRMDLLSRLQDTEQSLMTTTDLDLFSKSFVEKARLWHIHAGQIE
jgi:DNA replication and repair protein RecF